MIAKRCCQGLLLLILPFFLWGCAAGVASVVPAATIAAKTGYKAIQASRPISDSEEYYVGRAVAARILTKYPLYQNPKVTEYVNEVGQTVARKSPRPNVFRGYHFAVLDTEEVNAFACPGGIILITRGMLKSCANEDQLAAVLAHEVSHIAHKDGINSISKARWTEVLTTLGTEAAKQYAGAAGSLITLFEGSIDDVFKTIVVNGYSRGAELEADKEAVVILGKAGYNPGAMVALLEKMGSKGDPEGGIMKTHPPCSERLTQVKAQAKEAATGKMAQVREKRFKELKI
ncbi:MAG: M48 family metalloprotease [Thermodesulfobacteriota bacterium]